MAALVRQGEKRCAQPRTCVQREEMCEETRVAGEADKLCLDQTVSEGLSTQPPASRLPKHVYNASSASALHRYRNGMILGGGLKLQRSHYRRGQAMALPV